MPVWALVVSVAIGLVYVIPAGYVYALTSYNVGLIHCFLSGQLMLKLATAVTRLCSFRST